jgi:hypothetical protein
VALEVATPRSNFVGSGEKVAAEIIRWVDEARQTVSSWASRWWPKGWTTSSPMCCRCWKRAAASRQLDGRTLRDHLGLPRKESRYQQAAEHSSQQQVA